MNARQTAAFWMELVLQFGGDHLRPTSMQLTWWQLYMFCLNTLAVIFKKSKELTPLWFKVQCILRSSDCD